MFQLKQTTVYHITSEPGDCTRYDYLVYRDFEDFNFMPATSKFTFPQRLNYWAVRDMLTIENAIMYHKECDMGEVNPHTLLECARAIRAIMELEEL